MFNFKKVASTVAIACSLISASIAPAAIEQHVNNDIATCTLRAVDLGEKPSGKANGFKWQSMCEWELYRINIAKKHNSK